MSKAMISTTNNPYNPFTQYDEWASFDEKVCHYNTASYLARIASTSSELSGPDNERIIEDAIDEIVAMDLVIIDPMTNERVHYVKIKADD